MAFQKQYPDNRQKAPEQVRHFSALASDVFSNTAYPINHAAANNLKRVVETVSASEYFSQPPAAIEQPSAMDAFAHGLLQNEIASTTEGGNV